MKLRDLRHHQHEKNGHYDVHSHRQGGDEASRFGPLTRREFLQNRRVRIGVSSPSRAWRPHV